MIRPNSRWTWGNSGNNIRSSSSDPVVATKLESLKADIAALKARDSHFFWTCYYIRGTCGARKDCSCSVMANTIQCQGVDGVGAILSQDDHPVAYFSKGFSSSNRIKSELAPSTSSAQPSVSCHHFEFPEILIATENFSESLVIVSGGFGKVYKGNIINGSNVVVAAIKHLDSMSNQGAADLWAEVEMLSMLWHCNLVSLIGYCHYEQVMILVYEFAWVQVKGFTACTLAPRLHPVSCIAMSRALIVLPESWASKISDFGLSKIGPTNQPSVYVNTLIKGTFGYLDPNYYASGKLTSLIDVYGFGVVVLEVLCRKHAVFKSLDEEQWDLVTWVQDFIKEGNIQDIIDSDMRGEISPKCLKEYVILAERCLHNSPKHRPIMAEDISMLSHVKEVPAHFRSPSPKVKTFKFSDLKKATRSFSPDLILGEGGFGKVFLGWVKENTLAPSKQGVGMAVAVKRLNKESTQGAAEWQAEVNFLGHMDHPNIIRLLGYCRDELEHLLVYKYMPNINEICSHSPDTVEPLSWGTRLLIMIGIASGLTYLHLKNIIHRYLEPSTILLDEARNFNAKLGGFGLARYNSLKTGETYVTTPVTGTYGYAAPEYIATGHLTTKCDIYSFGVVLLVSITGQKAMDVHRPEGQQRLVEWATRVGSNIKKIMDPRLEDADNVVLEEVKFGCGERKDEMGIIRCLSWNVK
ncbi:hypothetical protein E3N88_22911 [Mikania micrantha]|uniref:non-specific serine/threonine protein kinase n=1 Tax=Mikania micrantha TaxID=192012 RepID=A0A5N6NDI4_9ASTR|nr:hypothetical protein E3N88_22911 [Mikania micrantha]